MNENKPLTDGQQAALLALVSTVPEIVRKWGKTRKSVMMHIWKGNFVASQCGNTWLVSLPSVISLWGPPQESEEKS